MRIVILTYKIFPVSAIHKGAVKILADFHLRICDSLATIAAEEDIRFNFSSAIHDLYHNLKQHDLMKEISLEKLCTTFFSHYLNTPFQYLLYAN